MPDALSESFVIVVPRFEGWVRWGSCPFESESAAHDFLVQLGPLGGRVVRV
jgi:hypothetical protein